ncbi:MAG: hypothetical protein GYA87_01695, partial [Christensenellaceae bacterium]|nr:hypothetical protein [Christensenellaceae bacterium]
MIYIVDYIKEHKEAMKYFTDHGASPNEITLWTALFILVNSRAKGKYWNNVLPVSNANAIGASCIPNVKALQRARAALVEKGIISFEPGAKCSSPIYTLNFFTAQEVQEEKVEDNDKDNEDGEKYHQEYEEVSSDCSPFVPRSFSIRPSSVHDDKYKKATQDGYLSGDFKVTINPLYKHKLKHKLKLKLKLKHNIPSFLPTSRSTLGTPCLISDSVQTPTAGVIYNNI